MEKRLKMKFWENLFLGLFVIIIIVAIIVALVLGMPGLSAVLLGIDCPIAILAVISVSLRRREEEEAKTAVPAV